MYRIYLAVGTERSVVIVANAADSIKLEILAEPLGGPVQLYEIGLAHPDTPPGALLIGLTDSVTKYRPLGKAITTEE